MPESGTTVKDLAGFSEPACKLIEAVRTATGIWFEPARIRRKAKAEASATIEKAKADIQVRELERRAFDRIKAREARRQENIESIVEGATQQLPPKADAQELDEDWAAEFMNHCQDISDEQMQQVWSRLLAGEFASPGKYSLRTLQFIKLLSKKDAETFSKFCSFVWVSGDAVAHLKTDETKKFLETHGLQYGDCMHLQTLGLVSMEVALRITFDAPKTILHYYGTPYLLEFPETETNRSVPCIALTSIGKELTSLCASQPSPAYVTAITESLKAKNISISLFKPPSQL